jgi:hypothetical protein
VLAEAERRMHESQQAALAAERAAIADAQQQVVNAQSAAADASRTFLSNSRQHVEDTSRGIADAHAAFNADVNEQITSTQRAALENEQVLAAEAQRQINETQLAFVEAQRQAAEETQRNISETERAAIEAQRSIAAETERNAQAARQAFVDARTEVAAYTRDTREQISGITNVLGGFFSGAKQAYADTRRQMGYDIQPMQPSSYPPPQQQDASYFRDPRAARPGQSSHSPPPPPPRPISVQGPTSPAVEDQVKRHLTSRAIRRDSSPSVTGGQPATAANAVAGPSGSQQQQQQQQPLPSPPPEARMRSDGPTRPSLTQALSFPGRAITTVLTPASLGPERPVDPYRRHSVHRNSPRPPDPYHRLSGYRREDSQSSSAGMVGRQGTSELGRVPSLPYENPNAPNGISHTRRSTFLEKDGTVSRI